MGGASRRRELPRLFIAQLGDQHFEAELTDANDVSRLQLDLTLNALLVHVRPVGAPQVAQAYSKVVDRDGAVMSTDQFAGGAELAVLLAPDEKLGAQQWNGFTAMFSANDLQPRAKH